ncbi:MAG: hemolysin III family protein [Anaerolineaceae bacterium]|jgi:hemolysin III|nr:hemolysin III family protein [Anaerolineaceae bacterium]
MDTLNSKLREPISALTHLAAAVFSLLGLIVLLYFGWGDLQKIIPFVIYGISLILMFTSSGTYHMLIGRDSIILNLRKLDHSAIYLLIAGTYTPICIYFFNGFWQYGMLILIWSLAFIGIIVKLFVINAPRWITAGVYLVMGWLAIMGIQEILRTMPTAAILWMVIGGLFYSIGAIIYITKRLDFAPGKFGFHEVWHIFVILGAFSHFYLILRFIAMV